MTLDLTQSREAVRRAGRATRLLLAMSVGLLVALGGIFTLLTIRQNALEESVREDALWAVYQLDREARSLSQTIDQMGPVAIPTRSDIENITLRYDILYSRHSILKNLKFQALFDNDEKFVGGRANIQRLIMGMEPFFNEIGSAGQANRNLLPATRAQLTELMKVTEALLIHTNSRVSAARADARDNVLWLQRLSAAIVLVLSITIGLLIANLLRQLTSVKQAAQVLENTASELSSAYEAAEAGNRTKSEFMATIGHEIRTPLNAILGMAELLSSSRLSPEDRKNVDVISASGTALLEMLNEILDFAKIEHGKMDAEAIPFNVRALVTDTARIVDGRARSQNNRIDLLLEGLPEPSWYLGDPTLVHRVLLNLLSNAVKFTENGIVKVRVSTLAAETGERLRFEVADTGIGISIEARGRLFAAFSQVDGSISRRFGGTGLGLAICKRIVEGLGGQIGVESTPGLGSLFWFEVPALRTEPVAAVVEKSPADAGVLPSMSVLVIEDNPINREVAEKFLVKLGQRVTLAEDGAKGVEAAAAGAFDLILMDMQMPVMDGIAAARAIRAAGNQVPIVAMTANASDRDRLLCDEAGMNGFEAKPITLKRLAVVLRQYGSPSSVPAVVLAEKAVPSRSQDVDRERMQELADTIGEDGLRHLFDMFQAELPEMMEKLDAAIATKSDDQFDRALHALKGAASNLGLVSVATLAESYRHNPIEPSAASRIAAEIARIDIFPDKKAA